MRTDVIVGSTRWTPDGTQPPKPLPLFDDPLAGLVTGALPGSAMTGDSYDEVAVRVPKPVDVDRDAVKAKLKAALADDDEPPPTGRPVKLPPPAKFTGLAPGMLPEPERRSARQRVKQALGSYPGGAGERGKQLADRRQELMAQRFGAKRPTDTEAPGVRPARPNRSLGGVIVALVLLAVFGFIAIQVVVSIVESIGGIVD